MNRFSFPPQAFALLIILLAAFSTAQAQASRTWVSGVGDDANPCSRTAPCKTFAGAISKTAAGGEINAIDPGGFGGVTITKAITINGGGTFASILANGTNGVVVNAGATDVVALKNLSLTGLGTGLAGIRYNSGVQLIVENCTIGGFATGIDVNLSATGALNVRNVSIDQGGVGVKLNATTGFITALIDDLRTVALSTYGVQTQNNAFVTVSNSKIDRTSSGGTSAGLEAESNSNINAENVILTFNQNAVRVASSTATVRLSNCNILSNQTGLSNPGGGSIVSFGNNRMAGNTTNGVMTSTVSQN